MRGADLGVAIVHQASNAPRAKLITSVHSEFLHVDRHDITGCVQLYAACNARYSESPVAADLDLDGRDVD